MARVARGADLPASARASTVYTAIHGHHPTVRLR